MQITTYIKVAQISYHIAKKTLRFKKHGRLYNIGAHRKSTTSESQCICILSQTATTDPTTNHRHHASASSKFSSFALSISRSFFISIVSTETYIHICTHTRTHARTLHTRLVEAEQNKEITSERLREGSARAGGRQEGARRTEASKEKNMHNIGIVRYEQDGQY